MFSRSGDICRQPCQEGHLWSKWSLCPDWSGHRQRRWGVLDWLSFQRRSFCFLATFQVVDSVLTKTKKRTLNPRWEEEFLFRLKPSEHKLVMEVGPFLQYPGMPISPGGVSWRLFYIHILRWFAGVWWKPSDQRWFPRKSWIAAGFLATGGRGCHQITSWLSFYCRIMIWWLSTIPIFFRTERSPTSTTYCNLEVQDPRWNKSYPWHCCPISSFLLS